MRPKLRRGLIILLALVCALCLVLVVRSLWGYHLGHASYTQAETLAGMEDPDTNQIDVDPYGVVLENLDLDALRQVNDQVLGWLFLPDTPISYPLVQTDNNTYYLTHSWDQTATSVGAIFLEYRSSPDFSDFNTIIYGHRMNNETMFHGLHAFQDQAYYEAHPTVYLATDQGVTKYTIFAAYEVSTQGSAYRLLRESNSREAKEKFLSDCLAASVITPSFTPTADTKVLTLSTCTGRGHATRWVVQAARAGEG
jgi:sortase B